MHIFGFKFSFWISIDFSVWRVFRWSDGEFAICVKWSMLALVLIQWVEVQCELEFQFSYAISQWSFFVALSTSKRTKIVLYLEKLFWLYNFFANLEDYWTQFAITSVMPLFHPEEERFKRGRKQRRSFVQNVKNFFIKA